jgi:hypothetical protein
LATFNSVQVSEANGKDAPWSGVSKSMIAGQTVKGDGDFAALYLHFSLMC